MLLCLWNDQNKEQHHLISSPLLPSRQLPSPPPHAAAAAVVVADHCQVQHRLSKQLCCRNQAVVKMSLPSVSTPEKARTGYPIHFSKQQRNVCGVCEILQGTKCMHNRNARIRVKRSLKGSKMFIQVRSKRISLHCPRSSSSPVRSSNTAALLRCRCSRRRSSFQVHCCGAHLLERCASCCSSVG